MKMASVAALLLASSLVVGASTTVEATHGSRICFPLSGDVDATFAAEGCTSPVGICTQGTFRSFFGRGTTSFTATGLTVGAVGEPETSWAYTGVFTVTIPRKGSIVFSDLGVLDNVVGTFTELERPVSGTGWFEDVSGAGFVSGTVKPDGSGFVGRLTSDLCISPF
jgi:hypothetical protein